MKLEPERGLEETTSSGVTGWGGRAQARGTGAELLGHNTSIGSTTSRGPIIGLNLCGGLNSNGKGQESGESFGEKT